jgi:sulfonate transport system substrate-binding protein
VERTEAAAAPLEERMRHRRSRSLAALVGGLLLLSATAACGGDDDNAAGTGGDGADPAAAPGDGAIPEGTVLRVADQGQQLQTLLASSGELDGAPYEIRFSDFMGGPAVNEAFAAGEVDVGTMGDTPAINNLAAGLGTVVVAASVSDGTGAKIYARADSGIEDLDDLEGHELAYTSGTNTQGFVLRALDSVGLSEPDVEQVDVPLTDLPTVLGRGDADAGVIYEFAEHDFVAEHPDAVELVTFADLVPVYGFILATRDAVDDPARGAALEDLVTRLGRAYAWADANRGEWVQDFYVDSLGQSPEAAEAVAEAQGAPRLVEITDEIRDDQQHQADLLFEVGELPDEVDLDDQFVPEVTERFNAVVAALAADGPADDPTDDPTDQTTTTAAEEAAP